MRPEVDAQHRDLGVAGQFGGAQERAVAAEHQHQFAAFGGAFVGVDHIDVDAHGPQVGGIEVQRTAVDGLGGQDPQADPVVAQHFLHPARGLGGFVAAGVHDEQDHPFTRSLRSLRDGAAHRGVQFVSVQRAVGLGTQPQEVLDVARRARAAGWP